MISVIKKKLINFFSTELSIRRVKNFLEDDNIRTRKRIKYAKREKKSVIP